MKTHRAVLSLVLTAILIFSVGALSFAEDYSGITVSGAEDGDVYRLYRLLEWSEEQPAADAEQQFLVSSSWLDFWAAPESGFSWMTVQAEGTDPDQPASAVWNSEQQTPEDLAALADVAAAFAEEHAISSDAEDMTAENGAVEWLDLEKGCYLITSDSGLARIVLTTPSEPNPIVFLAQAVSSEEPALSASEDEVPAETEEPSASEDSAPLPAESEESDAAESGEPDSAEGEEPPPAESEEPDSTEADVPADNSEDEAEDDDAPVAEDNLSIFYVIGAVLLCILSMVLVAKKRA